MTQQFFEYGHVETDYLKGRDAKLGEVIDSVGHIYRQVDSDLFASVIHHIIGQQISTKAQATIWNRFLDEYGNDGAEYATIRPETVASQSIDSLQSLGITYRKAGYILDFAQQVSDGRFNLADMREQDDAEIIRQLSALKGIGTWTAEMIMLFCMQRPNVFAFDDLAIQRGLRMVYHHRRISTELFERYRRRFSPYCSVASLYLWAVASGTVPGMRDYAPKSSGKKRFVKATTHSAQTTPNPMPHATSRGK